MRYLEENPVVPIVGLIISLLVFVIYMLATDHTQAVNRVEDVIERCQQMETISTEYDTIIHFKCDDRDEYFDAYLVHAALKRKYRCVHKT